VGVALGAAGVWFWTRSSGRRATPLRGWVGVALLLSTYELALNALAGRRYDAMWWSSLSLRAAGFAVLAGGCLGYVLRQGRRVERYSAAELVLRDCELQGSVTVVERLLVHARELARSRTPTEVAATLCATAQALAGVNRVRVGHRQAGRRGMVLLASTGADPESTDGAALPGGVTAPVYLATSADIAAHQAVTSWPATGAAAMAVLPLSVSDLTIGILVLDDARPRAWSRADRELLEGLADQAGPVLSRARLAAREHRAAETLQRSLLPRVLPDVAGLALAARYQPADREDRVGGDWYDGWTTPDGRTALVIGDVVGKGLGAAASTGRLRASVRALAASDASPNSVLTRLDHLEAADGSRMVATVLYALFDADVGGVSLARAGHPPAVIAPREGSPFLVATGGPPIGLGVGQIEQTWVRLEPGTDVVMYTDGLVESRAQSIDSRLADLLAAVGSGPRDGDASALATRLMTQFRATDGDDVAVLVASRRTHDC
jgi:hypothetical protein